MDDSPLQAVYASEARLQRLAAELAREHSLADARWDYDDQRRDALAVIVESAARRHGLDACQSDFLRRCLDDLAAPSLERTERHLRLLLAPDGRDDQRISRTIDRLRKGHGAA